MILEQEEEVKNISRITLLLSLLILLAFASCTTAKSHAPFPDGIYRAHDLVVKLSLSQGKTTDEGPQISGALNIHNETGQMLTLKHPADRQVVVFFVSDELGNIVSPVGNAKVNPLYRDPITLEPGEGFVQEFENLYFVTGSARFGYEWESGKTYRALAVYRPWGQNATGVTSNEVYLEVK